MLPRRACPATAFARIAPMCSGVVPQQPPTALTKPFAGPTPRSAPRCALRKLVVFAEVVRQAGVRICQDQRVGDAFGKLWSGTAAANPRRTRSSRPIVSGLEACRTAYQNAVDRMTREVASAHVGNREADSISGISSVPTRPRPDRATAMISGLGVQRVEASSRPAGNRLRPRSARSHCSRYSALSAVVVDLAR